MLGRKRLLVLLTVTAVAGLVLACGGGDDGGPDASSSVTPAVCQRITTDSFSYTVQATQEIKELEGTPIPSAPPGPPPYTFSETVEGEIENGTELQVTVTNTDGTNKTTFQAVQLDDGRAWIKYEGDPAWTAHDLTIRPLPVRYWPQLVCNGIAPDVQVGALQPKADEVNGTAAKKYEIRGLNALFFAREPDFGPGSDAAQYVSNVDADVWIADDGGYVAKLDLTGTGQYPDGRPIIIRLVFELKGMDDSIKIEPPA